MNAICGTKLGSPALDGRSSLSYALKKWRRELVNDLGGDDNISTQQAALVDLTVKSKLLLDSIDAWLLTQPTLINKRKKSLLLQRQTLADGLARYLAQLGLERRHNTKTLDDILNEDEPVSGSNGAGQGNVSIDAPSCVSEPLTANPDSSEGCGNPFCQHRSMERQAGKEVLL
jgi:hypothetical protein